jgi:hypothetical protein
VGRDEPEQRLRTESVEEREPNLTKRGSARAMESRARAVSEREAIAANFRAGLAKELQIDGSASQAALIDAAVSAHLEISVVSLRFVRGRATADELSGARLARGQLVRALRALGVGKKASGAASDPSGIGPAPDTSAPLEERQAWSRRYVAAVLEADRKDGAP